MAELAYPDGHVVRVEFDDTAHSYVVAHKLDNGSFSDYRPTHGATTPLEVVPKPFLKPWASKLAVHETLEFAYNNPDQLEKVPQMLQDLEDFAAGTLNEKGKKKVTYYYIKKHYPWLAHLKKAYDRASKDGQEAGTWLHEAIETFYKTDRKVLPIITPFVQPMWESFITFDNYWKPKPDPDGLEFIVYSLLYGYSGQGDFRGTMNGKKMIGDWKTTNRSEWSPDGISVEYFFQVGGLAQAEFERTGEWVEDLFIANFDKKGEEPRVVFASDFGVAPQDCARAYISCLNTYQTIKHWNYQYLKKEN